MAFPGCKSEQELNRGLKDVSILACDTWEAVSGLQGHLYLHLVVWSWAPQSLSGPQITPL